MIFQLILTLLTDKASLRARGFTSNLLSESVALHAIPGFCSSLFLCLGNVHGCGSSMVGHRTKAALSNSNIYQQVTRLILFGGNNLSKSVIQSEEKIKQRIIDCLKDIEWDIIQGKIDAVMTKLEEASKLAQEWGEKKS